MLVYTGPPPDPDPSPFYRAYPEPAPLSFAPPQQAPVQPVGTVIANLLVAGAAAWLTIEGLKWLFDDGRLPRNTEKYLVFADGRMVHGGITNDLQRRAREHRRRWPRSRVRKVGRRTSREAARDWEWVNGFA